MKNKGLSLLEMLVGISILGVNLMASRHLQTIAIKSKVQDENLRTISQTGREIERVLNNPQLCSSIFQGRNPNATIQDLIINGTPFPREVSNRINITDYKVVTEEGKNFLQVTYENRRIGSQAMGLGLKSFVRLHPINARIDASGNFAECLEEEEINDKDLIAEQMTCASVSGVMDEANGHCNIFEKDLPATIPEGVKGSPRGGSFKIVYDKITGAQRIENKPCTVQKRLIPELSGCKKGKDINIGDFVESYEDGKKVIKGTGGIEGVRWVNVCVYRSYCEEDPTGPTFGKTYFKLGKLKGNFGNSKDGDAGTENGCNRTRLPCDGHELTTSTAKGLTQAQSIQAQDSLNLAKDHVRFISKYVNQGNLDLAYSHFGDLKKTYDRAVQAAYRASESAKVYPSSETNKAAADAQRYSNETKREFDKAAKILEDGGAFRGLGSFDENYQ